MEEYERVKGEVADLLYQEGFRPYVACAEVAKRILARDGIEIKSSDQNLPLEPLGEEAARVWKITVTNMLKPDSEGRHWIRVIKKEEEH